MAMLVRDRELERRIIADRRARGVDRKDEVWDGVYVMSPEANNEHQDIIGEFDSLFREVIKRPGLGCVMPGVNISDRDEDWTKNFRVPDVVVFLNDTRAINHDTFWQGGPDFLVEIASEGDRCRDKLPFYAQVGTREVLIVDRNPWCLEPYRLAEGTLILVGRSTIESGELLISEVLPLSFRLRAGEAGSRPQIEVRRRDGEASWRI